MYIEKHKLRVIEEKKVVRISSMNIVPKKIRDLILRYG